MDTCTAITTRRTTKVYTGAPIARQVLIELVTLATYAPNHRLTQSWRFSVAEHAAVADLVRHVGQSPIADAVLPSKLPAIRERLRLCGGIIQVTCVLAGDAEQRREDRDATAAAVQNLLLAAHSMGISGYWSTSPLMTHPETLRWFGADSQCESHVATLWLGYPAEVPALPKRHAVEGLIRWVQPD